MAARITNGTTDVSTPHSHPDAFRLITYRADDYSCSELLWNPRVAAAPQTILLPQGTTATRANGHEPYLPLHTPAVGHLVLVDATEEWAHQLAEQVAQRLWAAGQHRDDLSSQEALEAQLFYAFQHDVRAGFGIATVVTEAMAAAHGWKAIA